MHVLQKHKNMISKHIDKSSKLLGHSVKLKIHAAFYQKAHLGNKILSQIRLTLNI